MNDIKNAVQSVASYMLFDPGDEVMQQNLVYYRFYRERWHLEEDDFIPRPVRTGMVVGLKNYYIVLAIYFGCSTGGPFYSIPGTM